MYSYHDAQRIVQVISKIILVLMMKATVPILWRRSSECTTKEHKHHSYWLEVAYP